MNFYLTLKNKIFISIISIVIILSAITTVISSVFLKKIIVKQHEKTIVEKEKRIKFYIHNTLSKYYENSNKKSTTKLLYEKITELYDIENVDISVFNLSGENITSTLDDKNIDKEILSKIPKNNSNIQIHETTDNTNITYSYSYIYNNDNKPLAILKFPYIGSNNSLEQNLNVFLKTMTVLGFLMIIMAIITAYLISNNLTKALSEIIISIKENTSNENSRILYQKDDEFLPIANAYNESLEKIENAQIIIKKNERELAWRDLARRLAHDIKNPLTPMRLMTQNFKYTFKSKDEFQRKKVDNFTDAIVTQIDMIVSTISNFSSNIQENKDIVFDINQIIGSTIQIFDFKEINFIPFDEGIEVKIDKSKFIRIITNIITNSLQAIPKNKIPKIVIKTKIFSNNEALISISDNGIGIPKSMQGNIFKSDFTTKNSGSGLGLAIVKKIINHYNGKINVDSKEGVGSTFTIRLPLATKS